MGFQGFDCVQSLGSTNPARYCSGWQGGAWFERPSQIAALVSIGRTISCTSSDRVQYRGLQENEQRALVTPLVTEIGRRSRSNEYRAMALVGLKILMASPGWAAVTSNAAPGL